MLATESNESFTQKVVNLRLVTAVLTATSSTVSHSHTTRRTSWTLVALADQEHACTS
jgi:hypothetical protein